MLADIAHVSFTIFHSFQRVKDLEEENELLQDKLQALEQSTVSNIKTLIFILSYKHSVKRIWSTMILSSVKLPKVILEKQSSTVFVLLYPVA